MGSTHLRELPSAALQWKDGITPASEHHEDTYYSRTDGLAESRHVFLAGNQLDGRFNELPPGIPFTIAETGFGTGLNLLAISQLWLHSPHAINGGQLHFCSFEKRPLRAADMHRALSAWPELNALAEQLISALPPRIPGIHRLRLGAHPIFITLAYGDIKECLPNTVFQADAWFLDGFAPAKNQEMWQPWLFNQIRRHSGPGTTLATFTAAGFIRRGLAKAGFEISKVAGFGQKRDMTVGRLPEKIVNQPGPAYNRQEIAVIGAGIAGCCVARTLAERGHKVKLLDRHAFIAEEASGNPQGALYAKLAVDFTPHTQFYLSALIFAQRFYQLHDPRRQFWHPAGVVQLGHNEKEEARQKKFFQLNDYPPDILRPISAEEAGKLAGVPLPNDGIHFPASGWLSPKIACRILSQHNNIDIIHEFDVENIQFKGNQWLIHGKNHHGPIQTQRVVLANSLNAKTLLKSLNDTLSLPLGLIRGQITQIPAKQLANIHLDQVVCGDGYIMPATDGKFTIGATFQPKNDDARTWDSDNQANLLKMQKLLGLRALPPVSDDDLVGRASIRATLPDYMPALGPIDPAAVYAPETIYDVRGPLLSVGHGSKGLCSAPLAAEIIADIIDKAPLPIDQRILGYLRPDRFEQK